MKGKIASLFLALFCLSIHAQEYTVSTVVQKKNVLLETFVGTRCRYSAEAPEYVMKIKSGMGDQLNVVNVHCGSLSVPQFEGDVDYRTVEGDAIAKLMASMGGPFPNGAINRHNWNFDSQLNFDRFSWCQRSRQAIQEDAPVNLWAKAVYNGETKKLNIRVEGYFSGASVSSQLRLNVLLTENNFVGTQNTQYGLETDFVHQHMLRAAVNGTFGEVLQNCQPQTYFVKEYVYDVPAEIRKVPLDPAELELVVFVTEENKKDVLNSITVKPTYEAVTLPLNASITNDKFGVANGYHFNHLSLVLSNRCDRELTSATFDVAFNSQVVEAKWEGKLGAFSASNITLPLDWSLARDGRNTYQVTLKTLNGQPVSSAKPAKGYFNHEELVLPSELRLKLFTSPELPADYTYTLYDVDGNVVKQYGPYAASTAYEETLQLNPGKTYCFEIADIWGNGFAPKQNALEICDKAGHVLKSVEKVSSYGTRVFFTTQSGPLKVSTVFGKNLNRALATFSAAYPTTPSLKSVEAFYAVQKDENTIVMNQILPENGNLVIPANVGVVLSSPAATAFTMDSAEGAISSVPADNLLQPTGAGIYVSSFDNAYILGKKMDDIFFHVLSAEERTIAANRAYLVLPSTVSASAVKMVFGDDVTGIEQVLGDAHADAPVYDLSGRKVSTLVKGGVYIQGGKKFIVK